MKHVYKLAMSIFVVGVIGSCASYTSTSNKLLGVLSNTEKTLASLGEKIPTLNDQTLQDAYSSVEKISQELFPLLKKCNEKYALTPEYISTLRQTQKVLDHMDKNFNTIANKTYTLNAIYQDYNAKLQTIHNTAANDASTKIKVIVNSGAEDGFFVFGKLSYEQEQDIRRFRFNQPTQNATHDFVPGYYLFWLEKEERMGEPELHLIMSNSGEEEKTLVLKTPKQ